MTIVPRIEKLEKALGVAFSDRALLEQAVIHTSFCNENPALGSGHNERLEFLGDAVLDFLVAEQLYLDNRGLPEGDMTKRRASLVRRETLARVAASVKLSDYLLLGKGEESTGGREKIPNIAGALEAVIAAVYLDRGHEEARKLVRRLLADEWSRVLSRGNAGIDYKSRLQEVCQARFQSVPAYRITGESGPDHDKRFSIEVLVQDRIAGSGVGKSKKQAETEAARVALLELGEDV